MSSKNGILGGASVSARFTFLLTNTPLSMLLILIISLELIILIISLELIVLKVTESLELVYLFYPFLSPSIGFKAEKSILRSRSEVVVSISPKTLRVFVP